MTDVTTARALYGTPALAATFRATRALPDVTVRQWIDVVRRAVGDLNVRLAIDVGAGTGRFTTVLAAAVAGRVLGVEPIAEMVAARETTTAAFVRGTAEALPIRTGAADLVLMSMVYHHLRDRAAAIAELRRVLRPGGLVLLRTLTRETAEFEWMRFFPERRQVTVAGKMPTEIEAIDAFAAGGFACRARQVVRQRVADSLADYAARIRQRPYSSLRAMPDEAWTRRFAEFEAYCRTAEDRPVEHSIHFFVFVPRMPR